MRNIINKLKIPILAGAFVLFSASDPPKKNKAEDIKVLPGSGTEYIISRKKAEKRIRELAKTDYLEDAWIYHDVKLIDVGYNIAKDSVNIDWGLILSMDFNTKKNLYRYHPHLFKVWGDKIIPPSGSDFFSDMTCRKLTELINLKEDQIKSKVFDYSGEWSYTSNLSLENIDPIKKSQINFRINNNYIKSFPKRERTKKDVRNYIKKMKKDNFKVSYKKLK